MFGLSIARAPWRRAATVLCSVALAATALLPAHLVAADREEAEFPLIVANPNLLTCLAEFPDDPRRAPSATVAVARGEENDTLRLRLRNIKHNLDFDLFTVENSNKLANGAPDGAFKNFGLAWYQTDVHVNGEGNANVTIKTILLDQIFGFDAATGLQPTNTFHVGFWFNNPQDAAACGFDVNNPTPFNGEHRAGPLAMISVPDAATTLGPLCRNPETQNGRIVCNP
jgi:hypothetical protein